MTRAQQIKLFLDHNGYANASQHALTGDASFRCYIRIHHDNATAMLMDAPPEKEDVQPYLTIAAHLLRHGYSVPQIHAQDIKNGLLLLEDLGDDSFTVVLKRYKNVDECAIQERILYEAAIDVLASWHGKTGEMADKKILALPSYDEQLLLKEVGLFADWYLPQSLGKEKAAALRSDYMALWQGILRAAPLNTDQFVHRDYHADNLMWLPERNDVRRVGLLDFQDGVYGDAAYDMVSLLEDARRDVPPSLAENMLIRYLTASGADAKRFRAAYAILGAQRNSKIIGIFTRLAARDGKASYLNYLPRVWTHLEHDLAHPALAKLREWLDAHVGKNNRGVLTIAPRSHESVKTA